MRTRQSLAVCLVCLALAGASCGDLGQVEQGIVVDFDQVAGTMTVVLDSSSKGADPPSYDRFPPVTVKLPSNPDERGQSPLPGHLLSVNREDKKVVVYDPRAEAPLVIPALNIEWQDGVWADDPIVRHSLLPQVDAASNTVTTYLPRERVLAKITVPPEYSSLPSVSWILGHEVRYYRKSPTEAIRVMNLTRMGQP